MDTKSPLPREPGFSWIALAGLIGVATALASKESNGPPRRFGTRLGGSCVIPRRGSHPQSPSWVRWRKPTRGSVPTNIHLTTGCSETTIPGCRDVAPPPRGTGPRPAPTHPAPDRLVYSELSTISSIVEMLPSCRQGAGPVAAIVPNESPAGHYGGWVMSCKRGERLAHVLIRHLPTPNLCVLGNETRSHCVIQLDVDRRTLIETKRFRREFRALLGYLFIGIR